MNSKKSILYTLDDKKYINLTNKCPCACGFCVRKSGNTVGDSDDLWLQKEPTAEEVIKIIENSNLKPQTEIVFCGYGEPTCAIDALIEVSKYLKNTVKTCKIRLNTNGLGNLINQKNIAPMFEDLIDIVSVSLNAPTKDDYLEITKPKFGEKSWQAMLDFAVESKKYVPETIFSVVDVIGESQIQKSKILAEKLGINLRVREFIEKY